MQVVGNDGILQLGVELRCMKLTGFAGSRNTEINLLRNVTKAVEAQSLCQSILLPCLYCGMDWPFENPTFTEGQLDVFVYERGQSLAVVRVAGQEVSIPNQLEQGSTRSYCLNN